MDLVQHTVEYLQIAGHHTVYADLWLTLTGASKAAFLNWLDVFSKGPDDSTLLAIKVCAADELPETIAVVCVQVGLRLWIRAGGRFEIWAWGKVAGHWRPQRQPIGLDDMHPLTALTDHLADPALPAMPSGFVRQHGIS